MISNFEKLSFYRKVDVLVSIHVMGWLVTDVDIYNEWFVANKAGVNTLCYSTEIRASWFVARQFDYIYLYRSKNTNGRWRCLLVEGSAKDQVEAETAQLAICYAALKAVGFDLEGFLKKENRI
jgi:Phage ABA sandwich domain